ncbi:MAG: hypothetical protein JOZ41_02270, partial [Chloroflexi bacterium]|nr:hypothetical protein [Chloroflexota bacterium]
AAVIGQLGFLGVTGAQASYPGRAAALAAAGQMASAVIQKTPNNATTSVTAAGPLTGERT